MQNNSFSNRSILCYHKSSYYEYARVTKCGPITHTSLLENTISLPIVGDMYSCTRTRNTFASLIMIIGAFDSPSYCYKLSSNNEGSLCKLFLLEEFFLTLS